MASNPRRGRRKTGPSIEDVARLAGVSAQTVSRVSTGADPVREETRARVLDAMDQLGYSPNRAARALRNGSFGTIGVVAHRFERTGEALTTEAVVEAAEAQDLSVTLLNVARPVESQWRDAVFRLSHQAIDALVIIRAEQVAPETLALPASLAVAVSDSRLIGHYPAVVSDQGQGTRDAMRHLLGLGHRTVHHLAGPADSEPALVRAATWRRSLEEQGLVVPALWQGDWTARSGYQLGQQLAREQSITAVYCANDEMAFGLIRALHEQGLRVPQDVSVLGFDDIALSGYSSPPLTTVKQDFHQIGHELVRLVLDQLRSRVSGRARVTVPTELIVRETTAPPGR
ncbi:LacI family DNA-binding transcriptional regulator [Micropruina sp.]|uniref:LacI family DNA-binding transcriptional regulator n=1 Tax=Micropruina sp. TaxID=2737536 RepID=UPI0039E21669